MKKESMVVKTCSDLKKLKVNQLENKNQFLITGSGFKAFQSYNSLIAVYDYETLTLFSDWDYSNTTRKHLYIFIKDYCYFRSDSVDIGYLLENATNKRKLILKLIKEGVIKYDPEI